MTTTERAVLSEVRTGGGGRAFDAAIVMAAVAGMATAAAAAAARTDLSGATDLGLVGAMPGTFWMGLAVVATAFAACLARSTTPDWLYAAAVVSLVTPLRAGRTGLGLGIPAAVVVAVAAPRALSLMGPGFSAEAVTPLRVLLLGLLPVLFLQLYYSLCRSSGRLGEALVTGLLLGFAALLVPAAVAGDFGLVGMAWAWVAVQAGAGVWAALRLLALVRPGSSSQGLAAADDTGAAEGGIRSIPVRSLDGWQKIGA